jgi:hypothetical protein
VKVVALVRSLNSRWLAVCCTAAYLVVSAVLGAALLVRPQAPSEASPAPMPPSYVADQGGHASQDHPPPRGFQRVAGPAKVRTVIPIGWRIARAGGPGAMRASDPSDADRFLGYGGAPVHTTDIAARHVLLENDFAKQATNYTRLRLDKATYGGHPAIEWEYRHNDGSGLRHVCALYWLVDGNEYFVFASGPNAQWSRMRPVYDAMVANSRP